MNSIEKALLDFENKSDHQEREAIVLRPYDYNVKISEGPVRFLYSIDSVRALNGWLQIPQDKYDQICEIAQTTLYASQVFDDIQDNSVQRYGKPTAHLVYGIPSTINACVYILFEVLGKLTDMGNAEAHKVFTETFLDVWIGQGMDIFWREELKCPTEFEYIHMAMKKSGGLNIIIYKLMALFSDCKKDLTRLCLLLGVFHQIHNDVQNFQDEESFSSKGFCEDLEEGKFSFPIVHAIHNSEHKDAIYRIMRQRPKEYEIKKYFVSLLEKSGSFEYSRKILDNLLEEMLTEAAELGSNSILENFLESAFVY